MYKTGRFHCLRWSSVHPPITTNTNHRCSFRILVVPQHICILAIQKQVDGVERNEGGEGPETSDEAGVLPFFFFPPFTTPIFTTCPDKGSILSLPSYPISPVCSSSLCPWLTLPSSLASSLSPSMHAVSLYPWQPMISLSPEQGARPHAWKGGMSVLVCVREWF